MGPYQISSHHSIDGPRALAADVAAMDRAGTVRQDRGPKHILQDLTDFYPYTSQWQRGSG